MDNPDKDRFLAALGGSPRGNSALREELRWSLSRYRAVREQLLADGLIRLGRGRGGSVVPIGYSEKPLSTGAFTRETDLYVPLQAQLAEWWIDLKSARKEDVATQVFMQSPNRKYNGIWVNPDLVLAWARYLPMTRASALDLVTFEVKMPSQIDVRAVHEALGHRRRATQAWVMAYVPLAAEGFPPASLRDEARLHGVGLVEVTDPSDATTWTTHVDAVRSMPEPEELEAFAGQLSDETKKLLAGVGPSR